VKPFSAGEATLYGLRITPALAAAMQAMLVGDVDAALGHLDAEDPPGKPVAVGERLYRWFLSAYRAHILAAIARQDGEVQHRIAAELSGLLQAPSWLGSSGSYVLPSGSLHFVPWGILDLAQPVVIIPTADWLLHRSPIQTSHPAAVVGDPEFGGKLSPPVRGTQGGDRDRQVFCG
jgi:hypothetical protein